MMVEQSITSLIRKNKLLSCKMTFLYRSLERMHSLEITFAILVIIYPLIEATFDGGV